MGKVFKDNAESINAMSFSSDGEWLVTSSDDESINLYSCSKGSKQKTLHSKKYGVDLIRFTHGKHAVICASKNKWDESLRYLSLHDNQYLRYFKGHRDKVVSLAMSPKDDNFMSASLDRTIRLWDLRQQGCKGILRTDETERPDVCYDPSGLIFVAVTGTRALKLFDVRSYDKGPFATFDKDVLKLSSDNLITGLQIGPDGKDILLATSRGSIYCIDAFDGTRKKEMKRPPAPTDTEKAFETDLGQPSRCLPAFTPDAKFVISGSSRGPVHAWDAHSGQLLVTLKGHPSSTSTVLFNPAKMMMAAGCSSGALSFWLPAPIHSTAY